MYKLMCVVAIMLQVFSKAEVYYDSEEFYYAPIVPIEVSLKGRQWVTKYLLDQMDRAQVTYRGRSLVSSETHIFDRAKLRELGYVTQGSFSEMKNALSSRKFKGQVIQSSTGAYDVEVEVTFFSSDDRVIMSGIGYLNIREDKNGKLTADTFEPYMRIPSNIIHEVKADVRDAKVLDDSWGFYDEELPVQYVDAHTSHILIPLYLLESGTYVIADYDGNSYGWNLQTKMPIVGKELVAFIGQISSGDVDIYSSFSEVQELIAQLTFYKSEGVVYGRFPAIEIVNPFSQEVFMKEEDLAVEIWGTGKALVPTRVTVIPEAFPPGFEPAPIPMDEKRWGWNVKVPAGKAYLVIEYPIKDWDSDPNPKG